jgi:hypothetical protein
MLGLVTTMIKSIVKTKNNSNSRSASAPNPCELITDSRFPLNLFAKIVVRQNVESLINKKTMGGDKNA